METRQNTCSWESWLCETERHCGTTLTCRTFCDFTAHLFFEREETRETHDCVSRMFNEEHDKYSNNCIHPTRLSHSISNVRVHFWTNENNMRRSLYTKTWREVRQVVAKFSIRYRVTLSACVLHYYSLRVWRLSSMMKSSILEINSVAV